MQEQVQTVAEGQKQEVEVLAVAGAEPVTGHGSRCCMYQSRVISAGHVLSVG